MKFNINQYGQNVDSTTPCPNCDGTGEVHSHNPICWECYGTGKLTYSIKKTTEQLLKEVERLKAGDFTPDEFQNLCHKFSEKDKMAFCKGCAEYQRKLFGEADIDRILKKVREVTEKIGEWDNQTHLGSYDIYRELDDLCRNYSNFNCKNDENKGKEIERLREELASAKQQLKDICDVVKEYLYRN